MATAVIDPAIHAWSKEEAAKEANKSCDGGEKIAALAVLKNGVVLKVIFLNSPPGREPGEEQREEEAPILIGRHPDCNVFVDHPSVSRFHLEARQRPGDRRLTITDRSSIHGTWVSGRRIPNNLPVDLKEGDIFKLGASAREYRLQWLSVNEAFAMDNTLPPLLEKDETQEESNHPIVAAECDSSMGINENVQVVEANELLMADDHDELLANEIENQKLLAGSNGHDIPSSPSLPSVPVPVHSKQCKFLNLEEHEEILVEEASFDENLQSVREQLEPMSPLSRSKVNENNTRDASRQSKRSLLSRRTKSKSVGYLCVQTARSAERVTGLNQIQEVGNTENHEIYEIVETRRVLFEDDVESKGEDSEESFSLDKENKTPQVTLCANRKSLKEAKFAISPEIHSEDKFLSDSVPIEFNTLLPQVANDHTEQLSSIDCVENTCCCEEEIISVKENAMRGVLGELNMNSGKSISAVSKRKKGKNISVQKGKLISGEDLSVLREKLGNLDEEENWVIQELQCTPGGKTSKKNLQDFEDGVEFVEGESSRFNSDKENCTPTPGSSARKSRRVSEMRAKIERARNDRRDREPLQILMQNSPMRFDNSVNNEQENIPRDGFCDANRAVKVQDEPNKSSNGHMTNDLDANHRRERKMGWTIVVDVNTLLDDESFKSIKLLEGLRGTRIIVPRIVIRELDCIKRRERLFRWSSKASSTILNWIEECMEKQSWWIHVQNSTEVAAPTPPATPVAQMNDDGLYQFGTGNFSPVAFSAQGTYPEIVSPTAEDHILDCALVFRKLRHGDNVVVLSESTTLKIKAMAEGLLCEGAKEFRERLTNPYSSQFMWASSAPRGITWCCSDEAGAVDSCWKAHRRMPRAREAAARGLKLILLYNSRRRGQEVENNLVA